MLCRSFAGYIKARQHKMHLCFTPEDVASAISGDSHRLIAIDGFQGSGKTTLARTLGKLLNMPVVSADDYLNRNQGAFFGHLRIEELASALMNRGPCIFEGVCTLQILEAVGDQPNVLIYVKRMAIWGWADEDELGNVLATPNGSPPRALEAAEQLDPLQIALQGLWGEVAQYHRRYRPHEFAHVLYERSAVKPLAQAARQR